MSLFGSKGSLGETAPAYNALRIQTSTQGMVIPVVFGKTRITGNIIWAGDFQSVAHTGGSGGKGFGSGMESESYTYRISFAMGLCEGPIIDVVKMWASKDIFSDLPPGFTLKLGTYPQTPWSYLTTNHPTQALCYPGIAYVAESNYDLGNTNALPNLSFVIEGLNMVGGGLVDANPSDILTHIVTNAKTGLGLSVGYLDVADYAIWCLATGLLLSPAFTEQKNASDHIKDILEMTFSTCILHDGSIIKIIPYGDTSVTGNGQTWNPSVTPQYDLDDDDFLSGDDRDPVEVRRISPADAYNFVQIECLDRSHEYNVHVVHFQDQGSIDSYMLREETTRRYHHICKVDTARYLVQLIGQRVLYVRNTYKFTLGWKYCLLESMDIVTLTDSTLGMTLTPVRITRIEENENGDLDIEAEDFPAGIGHAATYGADSSEGYIVDFNSAPGNVNTPIIFNAPGILTPSGYELWCAISGAGNIWGGCDVYASTDNTTYKFVKRLMGGSRYGTLSAQLLTGSDPDTTHTLAVDLTTSKGALTSGTQDDADRNVTLCLVEDELISFQTATLTATYKYNLTTYLRRGCYGTAIATHAASSNFIRLDDGLVKIPFDPSLIGKTIYIKCCSFNIWTGGIQSLADVTAYSFAIGASKSYPPNVAIDEANCNFTGPYPVMKWTLPTSETDIEGYELRYGASWAAGTIIETLPPKTDNYKWVNYPIANGRNVTIWISARDYSKNYSLTPDSYALSNVAPDMSGTTITAKAVKHGKKKNVTVRWAAYTEPEDLDHYDIFGSPEAVCTITDTNKKATVGKGMKHKTILGLNSKVAYDWRVRPSDVFGDGTASN